MKKRMLSLALCGAMVATMFAGCGDNSASTGSSENVDTSGELTWKIGGIGPTTGGAAQYGQGVMNAIQIAVDEVNNPFILRDYLEMRKIWIEYSYAGFDKLYEWYKDDKVDIYDKLSRIMIENFK